MLGLESSPSTRSTSFALVTSLAAAVTAATGIMDLLTGQVNVSMAWTIAIITVCLGAAVTPFLLGERFPPALGLAACWVFGAVTSIQTAQATDPIMAVNNLVLYPMISCYLGWFFGQRIALATVAAMFAGSAVSIHIGGLDGVFTTWTNLGLASFFCLEAALYLRSKLERQVRADPLTGALNRNGLETKLTAELSRAARTGDPLSAAVIDLDGFKCINDTLGHAAGDRILIELVKHLQESTRSRDSVARLGGDEFVVLLPGTTSVQADRVLAELQASSKALWTYGISEACSTDALEALISRADDDLYLHKKSRPRPTDRESTADQNEAPA